MMELSFKYYIILALQFFSVSNYHSSECSISSRLLHNWISILCINIYVSFVMIYLETVVFDTSKIRNLLCILNWKLKPQLRKNLGRCLFLCIMNISLQNSKLQCSTYFFVVVVVVVYKTFHFAVRLSFFRTNLHT